MNPRGLLAVIVVVVLLIVAVLYLTNESVSFPEPANTGPPEVSLESRPAIPEQELAHCRAAGVQLQYPHSPLSQLQQKCHTVRLSLS